MQCIMYFPTTHYVRHTGKPYYGTKLCFFVLSVENDGNLYSLTLQKLRPSWILLTIAMTKIISGHTIMSGIPENHMVDTKIMNQLIFYRKLYQFNI